jgi:hypothetical protein
MSKILLLHMGSGRLHRIESVRLFPEQLVIEANELLQKASAKFNGPQSTLGFIGSLGWVLAAQSASSIIHSWLSRNSNKEHIEVLSQASKKLADAEQKAKFVFVGEIENLKTGLPGAWRRPADKGSGQHSSAVVWNSHAAFGPQFDPGATWKREPYIHNGASFIEVKSVDGDCFSVDWSHVEAVQLVDSEANS